MELYNANEMPLSNDESRRIAQQKYLNGEQLSMMEKMRLGRDHPIKDYSGYVFKPDHCYRAINEELFNIYKEKGYISGTGDDDEFIEYEENGQIYNNNRGVDWYLGGASLRYGDIIIECPADKNYFVPASDNGNSLSADPTVKHMKSSGTKNPIPIGMITKAFKVSKEKQQENALVNFEELRLLDIEEHVAQRVNQFQLMNQLNESELEISDGGMTR